MDNLFLEAKEDSPEVLLDYSNGIMNFQGKCYPENAFEFFNPIIDWITEYFLENNKDTTVNIEIEYFNSSAIQLLFNIFDIFEENDHSLITINWRCDMENKNSKYDFEEFQDEFDKLNMNLIILNEKSDV